MKAVIGRTEASVNAARTPFPDWTVKLSVRPTSLFVSTTAGPFTLWVTVARRPWLKASS